MNTFKNKKSMHVRISQYRMIEKKVGVMGSADYWPVLVSFTTKKWPSSNTR